MSTISRGRGSTETTIAFLLGGWFFNRLELTVKESRRHEMPMAGGLAISNYAPLYRSGGAK
jgi:hypothetical protein